MARETASEREAVEMSYKRKRERLEAKERVEDMVGPKEVGKEGMMEKKRAKREGDRAFRERGDDGFEADEGTLLGGGDSFKERWVLVRCLRDRVDAMQGCAARRRPKAVRGEAQRWEGRQERRCA
jgi:hypothetical protein